MKHTPNCDWIIAAQNKEYMDRHEGDKVCIAICERCGKESPIRPGRIEFFTDQMNAFILVHKHCIEGDRMLIESLGRVKANRGGDGGNKCK